jgi:hypothetical protein
MAESKSKAEGVQTQPDDGVTVDQPAEQSEPQPLHKRGSDTAPAGAMAASVDESNDPVKAMRAQREQALRDGDQETADRLTKTLGEQGK